MRRIFALSVGTVVLLTAVFSELAHGYGFAGRQGRDHLLPRAVVRMVGRDKVRSVIAADKANLKQLHSQVRAARQKLTQDLIAGKDTTGDVAALETARNSLLAERVKLGQKILSGLSTDQRAQLSQFLATWTSMRESQRADRTKLLQSFAGADGGPKH